MATTMRASAWAPVLTDSFASFFLSRLSFRLVREPAELILVLELDRDMAGLLAVRRGRQGSHLHKHPAAATALK